MWLRESMRLSSKQVELAKTTSPSDQSKSRNEPCVRGEEGEEGGVRTLGQ